LLQRAQKDPASGYEKDVFGAATRQWNADLTLACKSLNWRDFITRRPMPPSTPCRSGKQAMPPRMPSEKEKPQESCDFLGLNPGGLGRNRTIDTRIFNHSLRPAGLRRDTQRHAKSST
jgi:hypothetical protein